MPRMILGEPTEMNTEPMATPAQLKYLRDLAVRHDTGKMDVSKIDADPPALTKAQASAGIDWLLQQPKVADQVRVTAPVQAKPAVKAKAQGAAKESRPTEPGYYKWADPDGDIYLRVIVNVKTGHLNYHLFTGTSWEYEGYRKIDNLVTDYGEPDKMTVEQIAAYGHTSLHCLCCGHDLSNPVSLERGIGPDCFAKYGGLGMF